MTLSVQNNNYKTTISQKLKQTLLIFFPLFVLVNSVLVAHYWIHTSSAKEQLEESQKLSIELSRKVVTDKISNVISEVNYLADDLQQRNIGETLRPGVLENISQFLVTFARHRPWYDHIRYLDLKGNEVVRINNRVSPILVSSKQLQNKANRYYFPDLNNLKAGQVYISPLDLNIEDNQVEMPVNPTIRAGVAVYNNQGTKVGYMLVNYLGNQLISDFKLASSHISDQMMLINTNGYWLISPDETQSWGFILKHQQSFSHSFERAWRTIENTPSGQFETDRGLFTFTTVHPYNRGLDEAGIELNPKANAYFWKVVSFAPNNVLHQPRFDFLQNNALSYTITLLIALLSSIMISRGRLRHDAVLMQNAYESSFRRILENIQMAAVTLNSQGKITFCNDYFADLSGYSRADLLNKDWKALLPTAPKLDRNYNRFLDELAHHQLPESNEEEIVTKDGRQRLLSWNNTYSLDPLDQVVSVTLLGRDITSQRDTEQQLIKLSQAVEQSPNTVMITNAHGDIEYVNPKFSALTGYLPEEVIGRKPSILKSGHTDPQEYEQLWSKISQGKTWQGTLKNVKKNGDFYWEKTVISPIMGKDNRIRHFLSVKEDITDKIRLEREVAIQTEETRKNRELAAVGQMANMVAHDLRNPLSSIKMAMQILDKENSRDSGDQDNNSLNNAHRAQTHELISIAQDQIRYMEGILNDLMSYSRPGALNLEWVRVDKLMETTVISQLKEIQANGIDVEERYQKGLPTVYADPVKLRQVFSNLVINAIHAVKDCEDPRIIVSTDLLMSDSGPKIKICVTDDGVGIDPCQANIVFEPFYTNKAKGTGLGLAIVKQRIEQHQGSISLTPVKQGGTRATLILPINSEQQMSN
ncbi:MAG: PAS domain S-box protein [Motiliproteus sp.]